jgi:membrane protein DedA with SNARE-associated domain
VFTRYGLRGVVVAKFVPGLPTEAPPLARLAGVEISRFLLADVLGSVLYAGSFLVLGFLFSYQIQQIAGAMAHLGGNLLSLIRLFPGVRGEGRTGAKAG